MNEMSEVANRGMIGPVPVLSGRSDEAFVDYLISLRESLVFGSAHDIHAKANAAIKEAGIEVELRSDCVEAVWDVMRKDHPDVSAWARLFKSSQTSYWQCVADSYATKQDEWLALFDRYDSEGPGTVTWDPEYRYPDYAKVEIHLQPGGFVGGPLTGVVYDYGSMIYKGEDGKYDKAHRAVAEQISVPKDGNVHKIMDIACAAGALTGQLKRRFPDAEVWGSDISAPMVRYAHYRAALQDLDIHFLQKAAEDLDELPEGEFDLVTINVFFHEIPSPVIDRVIANAYRLLRPGGTFWLYDFPTLGLDANSMQYTDLLAVYDCVDNCEPYAPDFVASNVEEKMVRQGFSLRYDKPEDISRFGRVADKPMRGAS